MSYGPSRQSRGAGNYGENLVGFKHADAERIGKVVVDAERTRRPRKPSFLPRFPGGGVASTIRLAQTSGEWANEPPLNVKAVQLFIQPDNPSGPADWIPETDEFGDPVIAVTINWFSHVPVGQGDVIKWCAIVPISDLEGSYDTGQVISSPDGPDQPIMKAYEKLWLLLAVEC
jgi:hypothetical protein